MRSSIAIPSHSLPLLKSADLFGPLRWVPSLEKLVVRHELFQVP